jgi:hypothetical protein
MRAHLTNRIGTWEVELHEDGRLEVVSFEKAQPMRGLGDAVARVTGALGIRPCPGCDKRREGLNRAVPFPGRAPEGPAEAP